jgi:hypothetical protein
VEASEHLWGLCPACRRKQAVAQLDFIRHGGQEYLPSGN